MAWPGSRLLERAVPDRANRALILLTAGIGYPLVWIGPMASSFIYNILYKAPFLPVLLWILAVNTVLLTLALAVGILVLSRARRSLTGRGAIIFALAVTGSGAVARTVVIRLLYDMGLTPLPAFNNTFFLVQLVLGVILVASVTAAIIYASSRERALDETFAQLARTQASLAAEEEAVRGQVFDQLHGSLQAEFVAMRQSLLDLANQTSDPDAASEARRLEGQLDRVYQDGVQTVTRALYPAGLEVGLRTAMTELQDRLAGAIELEVNVDPIVTAMDNPTTGGIHRDARMAAFRIVEEAVSNAMEHSQAREAVIDITSRLSDGAVMLNLRIAHLVEAPVTVTEGSGLARMRARARALGGTVDYGTRGNQFTVIAELPLVRVDEGRWNPA